MIARDTARAAAIACGSPARGGGSRPTPTCASRCRRDGDTRAGDVTLTSAPPIDANASTEPESGAIELRGVSLQTARIERGHVVGDIGDGKGRMKIETGSAAITLQRNGQ